VDKKKHLAEKIMNYLKRFPVIPAAFLLILFTTIAFTQPRIQFEPEAFDFGRIPLEFRVSDALVITNVGDERLIISGVVLDDDVFTTDYGIGHALEDDGQGENVHFRHLRTDVNASILIRQATWDDETLAFDCEIGVFNPDELCCGAAVVIEEGEMIGMAAWGAEQDEDNGFHDGDPFQFAFWDPVTEVEAEVEAEFEDERQNQWRGNGFSIVSLSAEGGDHRGPGEMFIEPDENYGITVFFRTDEEGEHEAVLTFNSNDPDEENIEIALQAVGYDNHPPQWIDILEEIEVQEDDNIEFLIIAEDPDDDNLILTMDPAELPDDAEFVDNGDGTGSFIWETENVFGEYFPIFSATDGFETIEATVHIIINQAPPELPDCILIEDQEREILFDLDDHFIHPDSIEIVYRFFVDSEELQLEIDEQNCMSAQPIPNFWIEEPGLEVTVEAEYVDSTYYECIFHVTVLPVNDPPEPFNLLTPADDQYLDYIPDSLRRIEFTWEQAVQNEFETDDVHYLLTLSCVDRHYRVLTDTNAHNLTDVEISDSILCEPGNREIEIEWFVEAIDDSVEVMASNAPFHLIIEYSGVEDAINPLIPTQLQLHSIHPNPFNNLATVRFGLPVSGNVLIGLYDPLGRYVRSLTAGSWFNAGWHEIILNASGLVTGTYMLRLEAGGKVQLLRVVLLR